jgi:TPR repeat protein/serine/threonine protein kinase
MKEPIILNINSFRERYDYDPNQPIREGGQGKIYKAFDRFRECYVAIKRAEKPHPQRDKYSVYREFKRAKTIPFHTNLAKYYDAYRFKTSMGDFDFGVMEFVEGGQNLDDFIKTLPSAEEIHAVLTGILEGIQHLHGNKVIHRDLKPANILVSQDHDKPVAKIIDFGISKELNRPETALSATVGTAEYMAPEQINNIKDRNPTYNIDLWSYGVILYRMLGGEMPFGSIENRDTKEKITSRVLTAKLPKGIKTIREPYRTAIKRCLVKDNRKRAQSAKEILTLLNNNVSATIQHQQETNQIEAPPAPSPTQNPSFTLPKKPAKNRKKLYLTGAALLFISLVLFAFSYLLSGPDCENPMDCFMSGHYYESFQLLEDAEQDGKLTPFQDYMMGWLYAQGLHEAGKERSYIPAPSLAIKHLDRAKEADVAEAYVAHGDILRTGQLTNDSSRAKTYYITALKLLNQEELTVTEMAAKGALNTKGRIQDSWRIAHNHYKQAAEQGYTHAMCILGQLLIQPAAEEQKDSALAFEYFETAATTGNIIGQYLLGQAYEYGVGVSPNMDKAWNYYQKAAEEGYPNALCKVGEVYLYGTLGQQKDGKAAIDYLDLASDKNVALAQYYRGRIYEVGGLERQPNMKDAVKHMEQAAEGGESRASYRLYEYYTEGTKGLPKKREKAIAYLKKAARQGNTEAEYQLGYLYRHGGKGVEEDHIRAAKLYQKAAQKGNANAQNGLAVLYENGDGLGRNLIKAKYWYHQAAKQGHRYAQMNLGEFYEKGKDGRTKRDSAVYWYRKAEANGARSASQRMIEMGEK